jgi:transcription-repair coupling factor (superfamily II helicase)
VDQITSRILKSRAGQELTERSRHTGAVSVAGLPGSARSLLAAGLFRTGASSLLFVAGDETARQTVYSDLRSLLKSNELLLLFPDAEAQLRLLSLLRSGERALIVSDATTLGAGAVRVPDEASLELSLRVGDSTRRDRILHWLQDSGYESTDLVTEPGEFAARGGIIDLFPDNADYPVRVELFGDTVESLRQFDPLTQRSIKHIDRLGMLARDTHAFTEQPIRSLLPDDVLAITEAGSGVRWQRQIALVEGQAEIDFGLTFPNVYLGNFKLLRSEVESSSGQYYIVSADEYQAQRLMSLLGARPTFVIGVLASGFVAMQEGYVVLTEREIYGAPVMREAKRRFRGLPVDDLLALRKGDHVVHVNYGIGVFEGIKRLKVDGREHDFLHIRYAENSKVYVPVENLGMLDRYIGAEDRPPALDRLGSKSWHLARTRTAQAVSDYAEELLVIYARRAAARSLAFSPDTPWQRELEETFIHEETPDQLRALADIKRDMESGRPMERLVCGDVGYGKTEVALRAAFKAVMDARQVAVLAPTTVLAYQHFNTFQMRTAQFPIRIAMLSRFVPTSERAVIRQELKEGKIDIVVGTHMLLSRQVEFKDLGLLIVDEEQRFGVRQKEKVKSMKAAVSVLTTSATPIPRTLYMSLVGLRDISTIHTPPAGRREIQTEVQPWNEGVIRRYVAREADRGGQVFFIHNRIESLAAVHTRLCRLCPELRIAMAHGRMAERTLANVYLKFAAGEYDVLVSTAIVESGLDLPRVNTIIVNRADWFGLADLHQLRGRVGRTQEQAYALLIIPDRQDIAQEARKRLSSILAYSQLGSGFKLAMRDMEIRGVGNLLGVEQHGHVARVGFSLYVQLLKEAVARLKGEEIAPEPELKIDVEAFIPESFISDSYERVAIYKRLLSAESEAELNGLRDELLDRFGKYPPIVESLLQVALVRVHARRAKLLRVTLKGDRISLVWTKGERIVEGGLERMLEVIKQMADSR